jgi:dihydrofolate reductase
VIRSLIVAHGKNFEIGKDNKLLWHLSDDLKNFKEHTLNKPIVMGRKTYESIGRPLPKRTNIILTQNQDLKLEGCLVMHSYEEVDQWAKQNNINELVYIGGGKIYQDVIDRVDKMYITLVHGEFNADTFFPQYNIDDFTKSSYYHHDKDEKNDYSWDFYMLEKK